MNILEKYTENLAVKKNLLQTTIETYKLDINEYLKFLKEKNTDILNADEKIFNKYFSNIEKKYKKATFSRKYSTIRGFYKFLLKNRYIERIFEYKLSINKTTQENIEKKKSDIIFKKNEYQEFIKSLLNSARTFATLVVRPVLVHGYELHKNFSKHIGKLVCRHGAKPCNKETELLGTLKASITTT